MSNRATQAPKAADVTVLLPMYRGERFLRDAVRSVQAQTHPHWRLVAVDDGSPDRCAQLLAELARDDPRILLIRQANGGVAEARNRALEAAQTPWVALLDQDDLWLPHKLQYQLSVLNSRPDAVLSHGAITVIDASGQPASGENMMWVGPYQDHCTLQLLNGNGIAPLTVMCRTDALRATGGFRAAEAPADDWGAWLRLSRLGPFLFDPRPLGAYRVHEHNETHKRLRMRRAELTVLDAFQREHRGRLGRAESHMLRWKRVEVLRATARQLRSEGQGKEARIAATQGLLTCVGSWRHHKAMLLSPLPGRMRRALDWWIRSRWQLP